MKKHIKITKYPTLEFVITNCSNHLQVSYGLYRNNTYIYDTTAIVESISEVLFGQSFPVDYRVADKLLNQEVKVEPTYVVTYLQESLKEIENQLTKLHEEFCARDKCIMELPDAI